MAPSHVNRHPVEAHVDPMPQPSNGKRSHDEDVPGRFRHTLNRWVFWLGVLLMATGLIGELLGWFDAVGVILSFLGMAASALALLDDRSDALHEDHAKLHTNQQDMLENHRSMQANQESRLVNQEQMVDQLERIGDLLEDRLPPSQT